MAQWTESAKAEWRTYSQRLKESLLGSEADAAEVEEDVRRHVDEEIHAAGLTVVDGAWLRQALNRMGDLASPDLEDGEPSVPSGQARKRHLGLLIAGVLWPLITILFEYVTRLCTGTLFDPLPSLWHGVLLAWLPIGNFFAWVWLCGGEKPMPRWIAFSITFNLGTSIAYTLLFAPLLPIGFVLILMFGLGLLALTPLATLVAGIFLWHGCKLKLKGLALHRSFPWYGILVAWVVLLALEAPDLSTRIGLGMADSNVASTRAKGVRWLRVVGIRDTMLRACYERPRRIFNPSGWLASSGNRLTQEDARRIFYQVTGEPFNAQPPPQLYTRQGRWNPLDEEFTWEFDDALGGTAVAGRVRGLRMTESRMDSRVETAAATSYTEWTMEFRNDADRAREARAHLQLPHGGVVSRLTLWVNGEEREAAFDARQKTRKAYQKIAVERRRDPVLVTTSGPDQVLVQCFPVPPDGGNMKIRLGITAPLGMQDAIQGRLRLPAILERNYNMREGLKHSIWIESRSLLTGDTGMFRSGTLEEGDHTLQAQLLDTDLHRPASTIHVRRPEATARVWTRALEPGQVVTQELTPIKASGMEALVVVVDGSKAMAPQLEAVRGAMGVFAPIRKVEVLIASDYPELLDAEGEPRSLSLQEAQGLLKEIPAQGGQDNTHALTLAWDRAMALGARHVLWIHGPQPVQSGSMEPLLQRMERTRGRIQMLGCAVVTGPNRILEALDGGHFQRMPAYQDLKAELEAWMQRARGEEVEYTFQRNRLPLKEAKNLEDATMVSRHIERLWAVEEVQRLRAAGATEQAVRLASAHQLVTPVTGAVVLETLEQFEEMGLSPVSAATVPGIPEPHTLFLWMFAFMILALRHWWMRSRSLPGALHG
jgi:hypothetical protein